MGSPFNAYSHHSRPKDVVRCRDAFLVVNKSQRDITHLARDRRTSAARASSAGSRQTASGQSDKVGCF
jgi:hypothetical protein